MTNLKQKTIKSSGFALALRFVERSLGFVSLLILARLLVPEDFGIVAIASSIVFLCDVLSETGGKQYIIQKDEVDDEDLNTAWTLGIILKSILAIILMMMADSISVFIESESVKAPLIALSLILPISAFTNPRLFVKAKELSYNVIFKLHAIQKFTAFTVTVTLAFIYQSYWAMIAGVIVSQITKMFLSFYLLPSRVKFSLSKLAEQWRFSKWMMAKAIVGYTRSEFDTFFASKAFGMTELGALNMMKNIALLPGRELLVPLSMPLLASLSQLKSNMFHFNSSLLKILTLILTVILPIVGFTVLKAKLIILVFLDEKWVEYSPLLSAMILFVVTFSLGTILEQAITAFNKVRVLVQIQFLSLAVIIIYFVGFFEGNVYEMAESRVVIAFISTFAVLVVTHFALKVNFFKAVLMLIPAIFALAASSFALINLSPYIMFKFQLLNLIVNTLVFFACYFAIWLLSTLLLNKIKSINDFNTWVFPLVKELFTTVADRIKRAASSKPK
uniref:oligosaccharide flippase family protein n=1 Tax=Ningiella ruwaisensis TaxID=2364274 RepID=UPI00109F7F91|nr:oligosaccharide flippase family protein [Ningiella ruwaisensis]